MDRVVTISVNRNHEAVMSNKSDPPPEGGWTVMAYGKHCRPGKSFQNTTANTQHAPSFIGEDAAIRLLVSASEAPVSTRKAEGHAINTLYSQICIRKFHHTSAVLGSVALVDVGSQDIQTTELFRTFQDVIVPERPAVHCSMHRRRL